MTLPEIILKKIAKDHRGKERAIKRRDLWYYAKLFDPDITDRKLRDIYSKLPVCVYEGGIFYPIRTQELEEFKEYLMAKAIPCFTRYKRVARAHPHLVSDDSIQMDLF